jgi:hypothetical protein
VLGVPKEKAEDACGQLYARHRRDQVLRILSRLVNLNQGQQSSLFQENFFSDKWNRTSIEGLINNDHLRTDDIATEMILDLNYWDKKRKLRRPKEWEGSL